jgi:hypothetical protein
MREERPRERQTTYDTVSQGAGKEDKRIRRKRRKGREC